MVQSAVTLEPPNDHFQTDLSVGEILRRTRLHYDQSLDDIERALRIRASQLDALETGNYAALPGRVYIIGFIRSYAEYLGLDGDKMVQLFKTQAGGKTVIQAPVNSPVMASDTKIPHLWQIVLSVAAVVVVLVAWGVMQGREDNREMVTQVPDAPKLEAGTATSQQDTSATATETAAAAMASDDQSTPPQPAPVQNDVAPDAASAEIGDAVAALQGNPAPATPAASGGGTIASAPIQPPASPEKEPPLEKKNGIILNIRKNSWVEIRGNDGKSIVSRVLKAGDRYYVPDRPDLTISLGNAGGVELEIAGEKLKPLGADGDIRRNIPLDAAYLKKNYSAGVINHGNP